MRKKEEENDAASYEGYCIDLLNELARNLKFTYEIYPSPEGLYGAETENGTWNGMIGELVNKVCRHVHSLLDSLSTVDPMHKWLSIKNSFVSIKISPTNLVFELIVQKNCYSRTRLVGII